MSKASTLTKLPNEIQEALLKKLSEGHTIDDLVAYVSELGFDWVSRSSMGRYTKGLRPSVTKVREARAVMLLLVMPTSHLCVDPALRKLMN